MNYLLTFANLLKFLFAPYPKPQVAVPAKNFAKKPLLDNSLMWMTQSSNSSTAIEENLQNQSNQNPLPTATEQLVTESPVAAPLNLTDHPVDKIVENTIKSVAMAEQTPVPATPKLIDSEAVATITQPSDLVAEIPVIAPEIVQPIAVAAIESSPAPSVAEVKVDDEEIPKRPASWITIHLKQQVTLANLNELQVELQQLLGKRVQLSGSQVQRVDTAALQLLLAFMHSPDVSVCWIDHSPALRQAAQLLGLSTLLSLPE